MKNPLIPFFLIMVIGIGLMFSLSIMGIEDNKEVAKQAEGGDKGGETAKAEFTPESHYKASCVGCHGDAYQGGVGPALKGIGSKVKLDEIKKTLTEGKGAMPPGLVPAENIDAMAKWVSELK